MSPPPTTLPGIRERIDAIDAQIAALVAERLRLARAAGDAKAAAGLPLRDLLREAQVAIRFVDVAGEGTRPIIRAIIDASIAEQEDHGGR